MLRFEFKIQTSNNKNKNGLKGSRKDLRLMLNTIVMSLSAENFLRN
jgi:hypothetical protein